MKPILILLVAILFPVVPMTAEKVASMPAPAGYVDDYAGVMTPAGKAAIDRICHEVHAKTKAQIFVVTIKSLDGETIQTFANDLFHNWKVGEAKTDRGVLLLFAIADRKWRIEVGYGLEGALNDAKVGRIGRDMVPALKDADYDHAALSGTQAVAEVIAQDAGVMLDPSPVAPPVQSLTPAPVQSSGGDGAGIFLLLLFFGFILLIVIVAARRRRRYYDDGYLIEPGVYIAPTEPIVYGAAAPSIFSSSGNDYTPPSSSGSDSGSSFGGDSFSGGGGGDSGGGGADGGW
jgi:uncharacterized protein